MKSILISCAIGACLLAATGSLYGQSSDWPYYGRDPGGTRYSPLTQINRQSVRRLAVAWTYHTGEVPQGRSRSFEATPLALDGRLYFVTPLGKIIALDATSGREVWKYDAQVDPQIRFGDFTSRGVSSWRDNRKQRGDPCQRRIFAGLVDARLIALDLATGKPCADFGESGVVDLRNGLRNSPVERAEYEVTSPPAIVGDLVITGSAVADNNRTNAASGEVRAYNARSGRLVWTWDPVPQDSADPGYKTWQGTHAHRTGGANAWSVIAVDTARKLVFVPTSSPSPDYFGGERIGDNRYANSIVALRAATGKVAWHFQTIHHDLWDYDNASPPALLRITRNGRSIDVVAQATKSGQLFVLERTTGKPVFAVNERAVPVSDVPGETAAATQPFSTLPALSPQRFDLESLNRLSAADAVYCRERLAGLRNEGVFTPISLRGTVMYPSNIGGAHWGGLAFDAARQTVVIPVNTAVAIARLIPEAEFNSDSARVDGRRTGAQYTRMRGTPYWMRREIVRSQSGDLCTAPPLGQLVGLNLATGKKVWEADLPTPNLGGPIVTAGGVAFIAATADRKLRAFDMQNGREIWSGDLPAGGKATPMTYMVRGKQYVVIAAGGDGEFFGASDALVAFSLPN